MAIDISLLSIGELYALRVDVNNRIAKYEGVALAALKTGLTQPDFMLKAGNKTRAWSDPTALVTALKAVGLTNTDLHDVKLKGIPAIEKLVKERDVKVDLKPFIKLGVNKPTLVYTGE